MRIVIQRVSKASLKVEHRLKSSIDEGLVILLGIEKDDNDDDIAWLTKKIVGMRIFYNEDGVKDLSIKDVDGEILVVSQFTLHARIKKGNRPTYIDAAAPDIAFPLYEKFVEKLGIELNKKIKTGEFGTYMQIEMINDGPVTIIADSKNRV